MYVYRVQRVNRVVDGDTFDLCLDLGFYQYGVYRVRLVGVDTPEMRGRYATPEGTVARDFVVSWFDGHLEHELVCSTAKADSFGRWLGHIECGCGSLLAMDLLDAGLAEPYDGR